MATALQSLQQFDSVRRRETKVGNNVWERLGKVAIRRMLVSVPKLFGIYVSVARRCIYFRELSLMRYAQKHACRFVCCWHGEAQDVL